MQKYSKQNIKYFIKIFCNLIIISYIFLSYYYRIKSLRVFNISFFFFFFQKLLSFFHPKTTRVDKSDNNNTTNSTTNNIHNNLPIHEPINATSHDVYRTYNFAFAWNWSAAISLNDRVPEGEYNKWFSSPPSFSLSCSYEYQSFFLDHILCISCAWQSQAKFALYEVTICDLHESHRLYE